MNQEFMRLKNIHKKVTLTQNDGTLMYRIEDTTNVELLVRWIFLSQQ